MRREPSGEIVYEGPDADHVPELIAAMIRELYTTTETPVLVRASMAHLNLVMIHPFKDGNGRMARCLQTLVLARERVVAPVFSSIEEYLGRNTQAYYDVLAAVGQGAWHPANSTRPWLQFCLTAHYRQAKTLIRRFEEYERLWVECAALVEDRSLPERTTGALMDAAVGFRIRNSSYRSTVKTSSGEEISDLTASRDLRLLVESGLFEPIGERRGRYYLAATHLRGLWSAIRNRREPRFDDDPYRMIEMSDSLGRESASKSPRRT